MSVKDSRPKIVFSCVIASSSPEATKVSIFSTMALMLATQSCSPYFWIGLYLKQFRIEASIGRQKIFHHSGYSRASFVGALLAIPPNRTSPYVLIENAVSPPARLPP